MNIGTDGPCGRAGDLLSHRLYVHVGVEEFVDRCVFFVVRLDFLRVGLEVVLVGLHAVGNELRRQGWIQEDPNRDFQSAHPHLIQKQTISYFFACNLLDGVATSLHVPIPTVRGAEDSVEDEVAGPANRVVIVSRLDLEALVCLRAPDQEDCHRLTKPSNELGEIVGSGNGLGLGPHSEECRKLVHNVLDAEAIHLDLSMDCGKVVQEGKGKCGGVVC